MGMRTIFSQIGIFLNETNTIVLSASNSLGLPNPTKKLPY